MKEITLSQREINIIIDVLNWSNRSSMPRYKDNECNRIKDSLLTRFHRLRLDYYYDGNGEFE